MLHKLIKPLQEDTSPFLDKISIKQVQNIVFSFLLYSQGTDLTILKASNTLVTQYNKPIALTDKKIKHLIFYFATHLEAKIKFFASDILLQIYSDAFFMNGIRARITAGGNFPLENSSTIKTYV